MKTTRVRQVRHVQPAPTVCDVTVEHNHSLFVSSRVEDDRVLTHNTMLRDRVGYDRKGGGYSLDRLCIESGMDHFARTRLGKADRAHLATKPLEDVAEYGAVDVVLPIRLMRMQRALAEWRSDRMIGRPYDRFVKTVTEVESAKLQQFCFMERTGLLVDTAYVVRLRGAASAFLRQIRESEAKFLAIPAVVEANRRLQGQRNVRQGSLFGETSGGAAAAARVFNPAKRAHQAMLFFDVLKLQPLRDNKDGLGAVDDKFKAHYRDVPAVAGFTDLNQAKPLYSTYIAGFYKILRGEPDNSDGRLRTEYGYLYVKTNRCLAPFVRVKTVDGEKEMRDVGVGDFVWTHLNRWRRVLKTWIKGFDPMVKISLSNGKSITGTRSHIVQLADGRWVTLGEIERIFASISGQDQILESVHPTEELP